MSDEGSQVQKAVEGQTAPEADLSEDIEELLETAEAGIAEAGDSNLTDSANPQPFELNELGPSGEGQESNPIDLLGEVELDLRIELGRTNMRLEDVLHLRSGSVVALDRLAGDPVDIYVNDRLVAKGEVLVLNENFCVRVTELVSGTKKG